MNNLFNTKSIFFLYDLLLRKYPMHKKIFSTVKHDLQSINLPDIKPVTGEIFEQYIYLSTLISSNNAIIITWDIEKILNSIDKLSEPFLCSVSCLLELYNNTIPQIQLLDDNYNHRGNYIILANTPLTKYPTIIDGNHRVLENRNNTQLSLECVLLNETETLEYLLPNLRRLFEILFYLLEVINRT